MYDARERETFIEELAEKIYVLRTTNTRFSVDGVEREEAESAFDAAHAFVAELEARRQTRHEELVRAREQPCDY